MSRSDGAARPLGVGSVLLVVVAAVALYQWSVAGAADAQRGAAAPPSVGSAPADAGSNSLMANPFSTFQQTPRDSSTAPPQPAPAMPFAFAGKRIEGGREVAVLSHQGRHVAVYGPGAIDAQYEVEHVDETKVVLLYLPLMTRQVLALPPTRADEPVEEN
jgi:hypothetical protein